MKRHEFNLEVLPNTVLCGLSISQYESKIEGSEEWHPTYRVALGLIFITFSYTKILISEDNSVS